MIKQQYADYTGQGEENVGNAIARPSGSAGRYYQTGLTHTAALTQLASATKANATNGNVSTQSIAKTQPEDDTTANSSDSTSSTALPTSITPQMLTQLQAAVQAGVACVEGGGCTAGQIDTTIMNNLQAAGGWTADELAAVQAGLNAAEPHGTGFKEQSNTGTEPFYASWFGNASQALQAWLISQAPPPGKVGTGDNPTGPADGGATPDPNSALNSIAPYLSGGSTSGDSGTTGSNEGAQPYVISSSPSGSSPIGILLIVAALGLVGWWWYSKHKHGAKNKK